MSWMLPFVSLSSPSALVLATSMALLLLLVVPIKMLVQMLDGVRMFHLILCRICTVSCLSIVVFYLSIFNFYFIIPSVVAFLAHLFCYTVEYSQVPLLYSGSDLTVRHWGALMAATLIVRSLCGSWQLALRCCTNDSELSSGRGVARRSHTRAGCGIMRSCHEQYQKF